MHKYVLRCSIAYLSCAILATVLLYTYPLIIGCNFSKNLDFDTGAESATPFRLLVFADPQLEGDTSLDGRFNDAWLPTLHAGCGEGVTTCIQDVIWRDCPGLFRWARKKLDLIGNDLYLAHIYATMKKFTRPTHVAVLGDLLGSQWISDDEFSRRSDRYWNRVFRGAGQINDEVLDNISTIGLVSRKTPLSDRVIINVAGNHDIGYGGELDRKKLDRFEKAFGKVNWSFKINYGLDQDDPNLKTDITLVVLNSMNLDVPVLDLDAQTETYSFLNEMVNRVDMTQRTRSATIILTHLPLYKDDGVCADGPMFSYYDDTIGGTIKEQNHLSRESSYAILDGFFGLNSIIDATESVKRPSGVILNGHDHVGCDVVHTSSNADGRRNWRMKRIEESSAREIRNGSSVREITVRSMMGEFDGNAGLLSGWFDSEQQRWQFEYASCAVGPQHIWWIIHIMDVVAIGITLWLGFMTTFDYSPSHHVKLKKH